MSTSIWPHHQKKQDVNMRYLYWAIGLPIMFALVGLAYDNPKGMPSRLSKVMTNQVYAVTDNVVPSKRKRLGTGVWIDSRHVVTNCHVAGQYASTTWSGEGNNKVKTVTYSHPKAVNHDLSKVFEMEVLSCDYDNDLALLRSHWPNHDAETLKVDWRALRFGEAVYSAGYGANQPLSPKYGYAGVLSYASNRPRQYATMPITSGDSGSPLFDKWGRLRGLLNKAYMVSTITGVGIPVADKSVSVPGFVLNLFLEENNL